MINTCPNASKGCRIACLYSAGRGAFQNVKDARTRKTIFFHENRQAFMQEIANDIHALVKKAKKLGMEPCIRLNGTSDIAWETIPVNGAKNIFELFQGTRFYDYTKSVNRMIFSFDDPEWPENYSLTFSRSESNQQYVSKIVSRGGNVAAVFNDVPKTWQGFPVVNGDETDLRFLDPKGVIVGLKAKGKARKDASGFVVKGESIT